MLTGVNLLLRTVATSFQVYLSGKIGAEGIGLLQLVLSVSGLAMTAGIAGIRTTTMYLTAEELGKKRKSNIPWVLSGSFLYSILISTSIAAALYHFAPTLAMHWIGNVASTNAIRLYAAFLPVSCLCGVMTGYFTAANRIATLAAVEVAEQLCSMAVTVFILKVWAGTDPGRACQAVIFGGCAGYTLTLLCLVFLRIREHTRPGSSIPIRRRLLQTAVPLALADDLKAGISTLENLMVPKRLALYHGTANPLALFGIVCGMVFPILMFPCAILFGLTELLIPEFARCNAAGYRFRIRYLMRRSLKIVLIYGCLCAGIEYLIADTLCFALYREPTAGYYLRLFAPLIIMLYADIVTDAMIKGLGQQKASVRYNILTSSMDVAFLFVLLPRFGMKGYFVSFLVTHAINFYLSLRRLLRITGEKLPLLGTTRTVFSAIASTVLASLFHSPYARTMVFLLIYSLLLALCKVISRTDLHWFKTILKVK